MTSQPVSANSQPLSAADRLQPSANLADGTAAAAPESRGLTAAGIRRLAVPLLAVAAVGAGVAWAMTDWKGWVADAVRQTTDDAVVGADVSTLSAQIGGAVRRVPVADYQKVARGDLLVEIDPREYDAALAVATANLDAARATLANLTNQIELQKAAVQVAVAQNASAQAQATQTQEEFQRQQDLGAATSEHQLQQARAAFLQADAAVRSTAAAIEQQQAALRVLQGQEPLLTAQANAAEGNLETARIRRGYTRIEAPFDGIIGRRLVHVGDVVAAGTGIVSEIPLPDVYITANFKETQLARMIPGRRAEIAVDTFPGRLLHGRVSALSPASGALFALLPPDNATGNYTKVVQRIPVRIDLDPGQPLVAELKPGMSAVVTVETPPEEAP